MEKQEKNRNGIKMTSIALIAAIGIGSYAFYKNMNPKSKDPVAIEQPVTQTPPPSTIVVPPVVAPVVPPIAPIVPSVAPIVPPISTEPEKPATQIKWDLFNPTNDSEIQSIIDKIIEQLKAAPVTFRNPSSYIMRDVIYLLNGEKIIPDRISQTFASLNAMLSATTCNGPIVSFIENGKNEANQIIILIEDMLANKAAHDYLSKYFASKQPIYDAVFNSKNINLMLSELSKFTDEYYDIFSNKEKFLGEKKFQDLPLEIQYIILFDFQNMNGNINYADYFGLLPKDIQIRYDFKTKLNKVEELMNTVFSAMEQRVMKGISLSGSKSLTANVEEIIDLGKSDHIKLTSIQYAKRISFNTKKE